MNTATTGYESLMRHALSLAARGPASGINPRVGCLLVDSAGTVVAEGWHHGAGTPHAEVDALSRIPAHISTTGLTAVVTLEPCNHQGLTGPCSDALIAAGITRVVYAVTDPGERSGGGARRLSEAGITVVGGVLEDEVYESIRAWMTSMRLRRPFVTVKWAASLDGRAAAADGSSQWITGDAARQRVHEQRAQSDAILVGTGTVLADDPSLTARNTDGELMPRQPIPVVIGERAIPAESRLFRHPRPVIETKSRDLPAILTDLYERGIRHAFVEGGPQLASAFIAEELVDQFLVYLAPVLIGGDGLAITDIGVGKLDDAKQLTIDSIEQLGGDILMIARPRERTPQTTKEH